MDLHLVLVILSVGNVWWRLVASLHPPSQLESQATSLGIVKGSNPECSETALTGQLFTFDNKNKTWRFLLRDPNLRFGARGGSHPPPLHGTCSQKRKRLFTKKSISVWAGRARVCQGRALCWERVRRVVCLQTPH